jgi:hypothetical protein
VTLYASKNSARSLWLLESSRLDHLVASTMSAFIRYVSNLRLRAAHHAEHSAVVEIDEADAVAIAGNSCDLASHDAEEGTLGRYTWHWPAGQTIGHVHTVSKRLGIAWPESECKLLCVLLFGPLCFPAAARLQITPLVETPLPNASCVILRQALLSGSLRGGFPGLYGYLHISCLV